MIVEEDEFGELEYYFNENDIKNEAEFKEELSKIKSKQDNIPRSLIFHGIEKYGTINFLDFRKLIDHNIFNGLKLNGITFIYCNLSGFNLDNLYIKFATFKGTYLIDVQLSNSKFHQLSFVGCDLSKAKLKNIKFKYIKGNKIFASQLPELPENYEMFKSTLETSIREEDRYNLIGPNVILSENFNLEGVNLNGKNLSGAILEEANFKGAKLEEANLSDAYLRGANFSGAYLQKANLKNADLSHANLSGAYLDGAFLDNANMRFANLRNASLTNSTIEKVSRLYETILDNVKIEFIKLQSLIKEQKLKKNEFTMEKIRLFIPAHEDKEKQKMEVIEMMNLSKTKTGSESQNERLGNVLDDELGNSAFERFLKKNILKAAGKIERAIAGPQRWGLSGGRRVVRKSRKSRRVVRKSRKSRRVVRKSRRNRKNSRK